MKLSSLLASVTVLCVSVSPAEAQVGHDQIIVGGVTLQLGATEEDVLRRLGNSYVVSPMDGVNWLIRTRGLQARSLGSISFREGRLAGVSKTWTSEETAYGIAAALHAAVATMSAGMWMPCQVTNHHYPGTTRYETMIDCGLRRISIGFGEGAPPEVSEWLATP